MTCQTCRGRGFVPAGDERADDLTEMKPCPDCLGGIASCCDAAGSGFPATSEQYRDDAFPERLCDYCSQLYRGPAVYCSLECATDDL